MGYIHCCGALRKTRTFKLVPPKNFSKAELDVLYKCPACGHKVVQLTKVTSGGKVVTVRRVNKKAESFWEKLKSSILYEIKSYKYKATGNFYLNYNEYGVIKRCYSNLSTLKLGRIKSIDSSPKFSSKLYNEKTQ